MTDLKIIVISIEFLTAIKNEIRQKYSLTMKYVHNKSEKIRNSMHGMIPFLLKKRLYAQGQWSQTISSNRNPTMMDISIICTL